MNWSPLQDAALVSVSNWLSSPSRNPVYRLFGYAGTGKTTLARHFAESCGGQVLFAAYTGKAASVMRNNGCHNATTLHRLIYKPAPKSEVRLLELRGHLAELVAKKAPEADLAKCRAEMKVIEQDLKRPSFVLNLDSEVKRAKLVVIDECSMVNEYMGQDLMSFGTPILVLGDPAQLPPVGGAGYFTNADPDVMLTEIHRQAKDSPIIQIATRIREGRGLSSGRFGESLVVDKSDFDRSTAMDHDQILVGRNKTRAASNARARELLGRTSHLPEVKDKLVCLRNDHKLGLLNGEIWMTVESTKLSDDTLSLTIQNEESKATLTCEAHTALFEGRELDFREKRLAQEFDFGYALTTHKAQGSQWPSVIVFDESACFRADRVRWLYTAVTRAAERVTVVTNF
jgi:exodeoxyribonuclease-5